MLCPGRGRLLCRLRTRSAVSGLLAHSTAVDDPYERLARTAQVMGTIGFGERAEANRVTRTVRAMHKRVNGRLRQAVGPYPAGTPYRADDPELLLCSSPSSTRASSSTGRTSAR